MSSACCNELSVGTNALVSSESEQAIVVPTIDSSFFRRKQFVDRMLAAILLVPALPLIGLIVLLVRATSRGPGIYAQTRVGRGGRIFTMYKIRSMRIDAEGKTGPTWAGVVRDPRVTRLGWWLRRLHLDELPQLFNVVRAEMSLVGPRPERPEFVSLLAEQIPGYLDRLAVAPGITGLAQINLPPDTDLDSVRRKLLLDCEYTRTASFRFDLRILLCTAFRLVGIRNGRAVRFFALERAAELPVRATPISSPSGGPTTLSTVAEPSLTVDRNETALSPLQPVVENTANASCAVSEPAKSRKQALRDTETFASLATLKDPVPTANSQPDPSPDAEPRRRHIKAK